MIFDLTVSDFKENLHSGYSGILPDPYHIGMHLLGKIVDFKTQKVNSLFEVDIPQTRLEECRYASSKLPSFAKMLPLREETLSRGFEKEAEDEKFQILLN